MPEPCSQSIGTQSTRKYRLLPASPAPPYRIHISKVIAWLLRDKERNSKVCVSAWAVSIKEVSWKTRFRLTQLFIFDCNWTCSGLNVSLCTLLYHLQTRAVYFWLLRKLQLSYIKCILRHVSFLRQVGLKKIIRFFIIRAPLQTLESYHKIFFIPHLLEKISFLNRILEKSRLF